LTGRIPPVEIKRILIQTLLTRVGVDKRYFFRFSHDGGGRMATNASTKKLLQSDLFQEIRKDLLDQLERNGTVGKYFADLVEDYMDLWVTKCLLILDIRQRGVNTIWDNGGGQKGRKKNDSVDLLIKTNAQMLKLLAELGIKPSRTEGDAGVDEEM
jgi:hypothetical protein